jgi:hypothetical protein
MNYGHLFPESLDIRAVATHAPQTVQSPASSTSFCNLAAPLQSILVEVAIFNPRIEKSILSTYINTDGND